MCTGGSESSAPSPPGGREHAPPIHAAHDARNRARRAPRRQLGDERRRRALAVAGHRVLHSELVAQRLGRHAERGAAGDHLRARRARAQRVPEATRPRACSARSAMRSLLSMLRTESPMTSGLNSLAVSRARTMRIAREAEIEHAHVVSRVIERGGDARHAVRHHGHRLALAIRAHEQHARTRAHACSAYVHAARARRAETSAPTSVHAALMPSLFSHPSPPARSVRVPQSCTSRSVALSQCVQTRRDCQSAPPNESTSAPASPPSSTASADECVPMHQPRRERDEQRAGDNRRESECAHPAGCARGHDAPRRDHARRRFREHPDLGAPRVGGGRGERAGARGEPELRRGAGAGAARSDREHGAVREHLRRVTRAALLDDAPAALCLDGGAACG